MRISTRSPAFAVISDEMGWNARWSPEPGRSGLPARSRGSPFASKVVFGAIVSGYERPFISHALGPVVRPVRLLDVRQSCQCAYTS